MFFKHKYIKPFILLSTLISTIVLITYIYLIKEEQNLLKTKYSQYVNHTNQFIENLIEDKENATLVLAIALSKDKRIEKFLENKNELELGYENISNELKTNTKYKKCLDSNNYFRGEVSLSFLDRYKIKSKF